MLRLVFESETVEFLLPNVPGCCHAGGKNQTAVQEGTNCRMREIRQSNTPL